MCPFVIVFNVIPTDVHVRVSVSELHRNFAVVHCALYSVCFNGDKGLDGVRGVKLPINHHTIMILPVCMFFFS